MNSIEISELKNAGPFYTDVSINFNGYINGIIRIIDNDGRKISESSWFNHEIADVTIVMPKNIQFSVFVASYLDPSFNGNYSITNSEKNVISSDDITDVQRGMYRSIKISTIDQNGIVSLLYSASMSSSFSMPIENGVVYIYEMFCGKGGEGEGGSEGGGEGGGGSEGGGSDNCREYEDEEDECFDILIGKFSYSSYKTSISKNDIPSAFFSEESNVFSEKRKYIRIYKIQSGGITKIPVYVGTNENDFLIQMEQGYVYYAYAECSCKNQEIFSFDVNENTNKNISQYKNASQFGIQDGTPWRLVEKTIPYKYFEGTVKNGTFEELPNVFSPLKYSHNGHVALQVGCCLDGQCKWPDDIDYPECDQHEVLSFISGKSVDLSQYKNFSQFGTLNNEMTWGLYDDTHEIFVLKGIYANGILYETEGGNTSVETTSQSVLRDSYVSEYSENSTYKFLFRCDWNYPFYNHKFYIIGFCSKKTTDVELIDKEYFTGDLNTLYVISESKLYPANSCYQNKRMNILAGPFDTYDLANDHKDLHSNSLYLTLEQQCMNRMTFDITWGYEDGCDLDISFLVEGIAMGWDQQNDSPYATWYGDDTNCSGAEQVSIDKNAMIADGLKTTTVIIRAHWYGERNNGNCYLTVSDGTTSLTRTFNSITQESSSQNYDVLGSVTIDLENDTFTIDGGVDNESSLENSLTNLLPEDLR